MFEGYIFQITCVAQSDPHPTITWLKDGSALADPSVSVSYPSPMMSLLIIAQSQRQHAGEYTCVASNPAGQVTKSSRLKVKGFCLCYILFMSCIPLCSVLLAIPLNYFFLTCIQFCSNLWRNKYAALLTYFHIPLDPFISTSLIIFLFFHYLASLLNFCCIYHKCIYTTHFLLIPKDFQILDYDTIR